MVDINKIREAHNKVMAIDAGRPHILVLHGTMARQRVVVGQIFGMNIVADPNCPPGMFTIEPEEGLDEDEE